MVGDTAAFWSTAVQTTPVLFIAVMFEYRYLLRRTSVDEGAFVRNRFARVWTGISALTVSGLLLITFSLGLDGLRVGTDPLGPSGYLAAGALLGAAIIAIGSPAVVLFFNATRDVWTLLARRAPWSRFSRLKRQIIRSSEEALAAARRSRDIRLSLWIKMSEVLIQAGEAGRLSGTLSFPSSEKAAAARDELYRVAARLRAAIEVFDAAAPPEVKVQDLSSGLSEAEVALMRAELAEEARRAS